MMHFKEWFRAMFGPVWWCPKGSHRWALSQGVPGYYRCKDCSRYVTIQEYRST